MFRAQSKNDSGKDLGKIYCTSEIQVAFILSSFVTFFSGLLILFIFRLIWRVIRKWKNIKGTGILLELILSDRILKKRFNALHFHGIFRDRIEMLLSAQTVVGQVLMTLVFVLSIGSLVIYFINSSDPVGSCSSYQDKTIPVDLMFNAFFSFYFGLRFLAAADKIKFWMEMNSIVDIFTIPPTFISYYLKSNWLGLRFLRALRLLELPQILQMLRAVKTSTSIKFSKLLSIVLSTWFTAAGFIHLVENSGDPWLKGTNSQNISYFESIYLVVATTSTVGFGDVAAKTSLGRTFIMFFILGSLVLFANYVPEMVEFFANKRKYTSSYEVVKGKKFIVVCGNITVDSVTAFLRNFLRHKSGEIYTEIVFLGEVPPSLELETILKCYLAYTTFISGSALKWQDLRRVAMFLPKIPSWNWTAGDNIICFAELKLGFIAQGCLVPGLCTFLTSLFIEQSVKVSPREPWQSYFIDSLRNKILTQRLSDDFVGMTFAEVARLCFVKMHLMLIAIEHKSMFPNYCRLILNPSTQIRVGKNTLGFFIAESSKDVKRAFFYCATCHNDVHTPELIGRCSCKSKTPRSHAQGTVVVRKNLKDFFSDTLKHQFFQRRITTMFSNMSLVARHQPYETYQDVDQLDSSGMFHWCKAVPLEQMILKRTEKPKHEFRNHVVACIFGDAHSTLMGLRNFVMPLRASNYTRQELKDIVFIGSLDYLQREWRFLRNFPKIYILPGSALYSGDLHAVNVEECSMCAVLSSPSKSSSSPTLVDTENIMATLNIRSLKVSASAHTPSEIEGFSHSFNAANEKLKYRRIPIITELKNPSNIHFIEQLGGIEGTFTGTSLHLSTSFSQGSVFSGNFLDSLLATAFYNYHVLEFLQMLVTGGISSHLEQHLDKNSSSTTLLSGRMRCKLGLLPLHQTILSDVQPRVTFGQLFCGSLDDFGILCIGLYRMMDKEEANPEHKRFVITRPDNEFKLLSSDLVFCAIPFNTSCYKKESTPSQNTYESVIIVPQTDTLDINPLATDPTETTIQSLKLESSSEPGTSQGATKQDQLVQNVKLSQTEIYENSKEREKKNMKETTETAPTYSN
ncbi:potassium channel subfamily U member 1 isoform X2 [Talpa occidentalis]|uniref:potassium channel subfamily U member 1 isoform X2 n=1 Tax=Talpa occidentalis TaxID=50954 RepID=UPI0018907D76|nr:potassium channel subfamily U member 1 isoform X2 [Talpa occidentalis]